MIELGSVPVLGAVTLIAHGGEARVYVVRICSLLELRGVTRKTIARGPGIGAVEVTGGALGALVGSSKAKEGVVIELGACPGSGFVALLTVSREARFRVIGLSGLLE